MRATARHLASLLLIPAALSVAMQATAGETKTLRIATLAPKNSSWGQVFSKWEKKLKQQTDGKLALNVFYNAVAGDEGSMVGKMRAGQLDGASLTAVGLSTIYKPVLVLQLPGVVDSWSILDKVRAGMKSDIDAGFANEGFTVVGWGDIGKVRQFSKGFAVRVPTDLRGKSPVVWRDEPMGPVVYSSIGGVTPVPLSAPEVLTALRSGKVNVLTAPALAAEQLQWTGHVDHVGSASTVCAIGGTVFRKEVLDGLDADVRLAFDKLQQKLAKKNLAAIREMDEAAYERLAKRMTVVDITDAERAEWEKVLRAAVKRLAQGTYPKAMIEKVVKLSGKTFEPL